MIAPLASHGLIGDGGSLAAAFLIGLGFGWALERAGLGSARKLMGQFYLTDFAVFKVMFTAIVTAMLGSFWLARIGVLDLNAVYVPETFVMPQLVGGIVFGAGFALAGLCPGTSCVAASTGRGDGFAVVGGMLSGILITGLAFDRLQSFYNSGARGSFTLPQLLHLPQGLVVCGIVAAALGGFWLTSLMERRPVVAHDTSLPAAGSKRQIGPNRLVLAAIAIALAVGAAFVGNPASASGAWSATSAPDPIERISAVQLAAWIKDRQPGLRVIDVRLPAAFDEYHVPTAERLPVDALRTLTTSNDQITVVYGDDDAQAAAPVKTMPTGGHRYVMTGGVGSWISEVMSPTLVAGASAADRAAFGKTSELSRYFGGTPRVDVPAQQSAAKPGTTSQAVQQVRRRGC